MLAIKAIVKNGLIKPVESIDLPEDKEIVIYISEEKEGEEYSDWTDEDWQRFSLHSFMTDEDDKDVNWEDFFNVKNR
jgi:predicted DNA-binding antitoxin AbrB/MazE fold protein